MCTDYHCIWITSKIWTINPCLSGERCSPFLQGRGDGKAEPIKGLPILPPLSQISHAWDVKLSQFCDTGTHLKHVWNIMHLRSLAEVGESNYVSETAYVVPWAILAWRRDCTVAVVLNICWSYTKLRAVSSVSQRPVSSTADSMNLLWFFPFEVATAAPRQWSPATEQSDFDCWDVGTWSGQISVTPCKSTRSLSTAVFAQF